MRDEFFCCVVDSGGSHSTKRWRDSARYMLLRYDNLNEAITTAASDPGAVFTIEIRSTLQISGLHADRASELSQVVLPV